MPADLHAVRIRVDMVGVVDHPRGKPQQLALNLRQSFQFPQALGEWPYFVHTARLAQSLGRGNRLCYCAEEPAMMLAMMPVVTAIITNWLPDCTHS